MGRILSKYYKCCERGRINMPPPPPSTDLCFFQKLNNLSQTFHNLFPAPFSVRSCLHLTCIQPLKQQTHVRPVQQRPVSEVMSMLSICLPEDSSHTRSTQGPRRLVSRGTSQKFVMSNKDLCNPRHRNNSRQAAENLIPYKFAAHWFQGVQTSATKKVGQMIHCVTPQQIPVESVETKRHWRNVYFMHWKIQEFIFF